MLYWILEATPQGGDTETRIVHGWHENEVTDAVVDAKRMARGVLRERGTPVHWAVYGPYTIDKSKLFEDGVI